MSTELTSFQLASANVALRVALAKDTFYITDFRDVAKVLGIDLTEGPDLDALRALHCVKYRDMGQELAIEVKKKALQMLGVEMAFVQPADEPKTARQGLFGRWF